MRSRFGFQTPIPSITSSKGQTKQISYKDGINTYKDNDDVKPSELLAAIDARFSRIGRYQTRRGADRYTVPLGEAINVQNTSVTGASDVEVTASKAVAQQLTAASTARVTRVDVNIKASSDATGTVLVEVCEDSSGSPGTVLATSSIASSSITTSYQYVASYFIAAPSITNATNYWVVVRGQESVTGTYYVSTTTTATTAKTSTDSGNSWSAAAYSANVKLYTSTAGGVKGLTRTYRSTGQKLTMFAHGSSVYSVNDGTGATTAVQSGMNAAATNYRFQAVQDVVYWVNGLDKPYKYDYTTVTQITACPYVPSLILEHVGLLFYVDATDKTRLFYSNFAAFDTFTSTDFIYVPAPKSYDAITALAKLNGILFMYANRNKFQLMGTDSTTFSLYESVGQKGTFSQESLVYDQNVIYSASDDGIYKFNGTEEVNIAKPILEDYLAIPSKTTIRLELYNNRLYVFHSPVGTGGNQECWVYNTLLDRWESLDKNTYIGSTFGRYAQEDIMLMGSNVVGALYYNEQSTNDFHNLGAPMEYELRTAYSHFDTPGQLKRVPKWRPVFAAQSNSYSVTCGYAWDLSEDPTYADVNVGASSLRYDTGLTYDSGLHYTTLTTVNPSNLLIPGEGRRLQRRYRHIAAREPIEFDSEVLTVQTQRLD